MITKENLKTLKKAKMRLASAIHRLNQVNELLDEYRKTIPREQRNTFVLGAVAPEHYMLSDLRHNARGVRQQAQRLLWTVQLIHFLERRKLKVSQKPTEKPVATDQQPGKENPA